MIKFLILDVDGTLTDGKIYMAPSGEAMKAFNTKDGLGVFGILVPAGVIPIVITGRTSEIVVNRCREISIQEIYQGVSDKLPRMKEVVEEIHGGKLNETAYIGDDLNDLACMKAVKEAGGLIGCPADAVAQVKELADFIAPHNGGDGAVRDFIEWIVNGK